MYGVTGPNDGCNFLGVTVDDGHFACVTQRYREEILDVAVVLGSGRAVFRFDVHFPAVGHFRQTPFRRCRRLVLQVAGHDIDLCIGEVARGAPIGHAGGGAVGDQGFQVVGALFTGDIRGQGFAGGAFAQHAVAAGAAFEVDLRGFVEFHLGHAGAFGVDETPGAFDRAGRALVGHFFLGGDRVISWAGYGFSATGGGHETGGNFTPRVIPGIHHEGNHVRYLYIIQVGKTRHDPVIVHAIDRDGAA